MGNENTAEIVGDELFQKVLSEPSLFADTLLILAGYASSAMAYHHMQLLENRKCNVELIVGMCPQDGISDVDHKQFQNLMDEKYPGRFSCSYISAFPVVHSKVYVWLKAGNPIKAFIGSANYTQRAFYDCTERPRQQEEVLSESDPIAAHTYIEKFQSKTIFCTHQDASQFVDLYSHKRVPVERSPEEIGVGKYAGLEKVTLDFLERDGSLPQSSGLNWAQPTPEGVRRRANLNEAYIPVRGDLRTSNFFPGHRIEFTVLTDDGKSLHCSRVSGDANAPKQIQTPHKNALLGEYFRNRLGLGDGARVLKSDLERYGRTTVDFYKIDDETYYMDFSV